MFKMMYRTTKVLIKIGEVAGILALGIAIAELFEYSFCLCSIFFVLSIALISISKLLTYQVEYYETGEWRG